MTDLELLNLVIADLRSQIAADQRGELRPATLPDGAPINDTEIAFFARLLAASPPAQKTTSNPEGVAPVIDV